MGRVMVRFLCHMPGMAGGKVVQFGVFGFFRQRLGPRENRAQRLCNRHQCHGVSPRSAPRPRRGRIIRVRSNGERGRRQKALAAGGAENPATCGSLLQQETHQFGLDPLNVFEFQE